MDKLNMELTWHNCKTCPPKEDFNPCLMITDGKGVDFCSYHKNYGFPISSESLHKHWWADLSRAVKEANILEVMKNENR